MKGCKRSPITWIPTLYFVMGLPFLELFKTKRYFVVLMQITSGVMFGLLSFSLNLPDFFSCAIAILAVIAFSGATHDIAADVVYMAALNEEAQARYVGWQGAFYNLAKIVATVGLVYWAGCLIERVGQVGAWMTIMGICAALMLLLGFYHIRVLPSGEKMTIGKSESEGETFRELLRVIISFFRKKYIAWYILFIILYRFAEGFVIKIVPLFLKAPLSGGGLGLTEQQIGLYYGSFGAAAFVLGALGAGYFMAKRGLRRTLFTLCCRMRLHVGFSRDGLRWRIVLRMCRHGDKTCFRLYFRDCRLHQAYRHWSQIVI